MNRTEGFFGTRCSPGGTCSCRQGAACCQDIPPFLTRQGASAPSEALGPGLSGWEAVWTDPIKPSNPNISSYKTRWIPFPKPWSCPGQAGWQRISPNSCFSPFLGLPATPCPCCLPAPEAQPGRCPNTLLSYIDCSISISAKEQGRQLTNSLQEAESERAWSESLRERSRPQPHRAPESAQVKSCGPSHPIHISSLLRALLHWCFPPQGDGLPLLDPRRFFPSFCSNSDSRSRSQFPPPWPPLVASCTSLGRRMEHSPPGPLQHAGNALFGLQERDPRWQQGLLSAGPQGLSQLGRQRCVTLPDRTKLLPAPDTQQRTDL